MAFKYIPFTIAQVQKRINSGGASAYDNFIQQDFETFTPAKGENWIRVLPATWGTEKEPPDHWGLFIFSHYGLGPDRGSALCLAKMGKGPCPVCDYRAKMAGKMDDEELKELKWRGQSLAWILDKNNEQDGPKLWAMSVKKCDEMISKLAIDRETNELVDFLDPDNGFDIYFDRSGEGLKTQYGGFSLARRPSQVKSKWLDYIDKYPVPETLLWRNYDEVQALFAGTTSRKPKDDEAPRGRERDTERARYEDDRPEPRGRGAGRDDDERPIRGRERDDDRPGDREEPRRSRDADDAPRRSREEPEDRPVRRGREDVDEAPRGRERPPEDEPRRGRERLAEDEPRATTGKSRAEELRERFSNKDK